ncbi:MAG: GAF domain-containing protein [Acidimicrobiia bacterium]
MSTIEDLRDQITREERVANLRADGTVTEEEIHRRRRQMFLLAVVVLVGLLFTTVANDVWTQFRQDSWIDPEVARLGLIGFGVLCAVYLYDKEQHLKRLSALGRDVQDLDAALAATMLRSAFVADATEAVHASLGLDQVVQSVVDESCRLVGAGSASLRLTDEDGDLRPVAAQVDITGREPSEPAEPSDELLGVVGRTRETALLNSGTMSVLCVPLVHDEQLLGLITLGASAADRFDDEDAALIGRFARPAANAISNARRYEAAVFLLDTDATPDAA